MIEFKTSNTKRDHVVKSYRYLLLMFILFLWKQVADITTFLDVRVIEFGAMKVTTPVLQELCTSGKNQSNLSGHPSIVTAVCQ